MCAYLATIFPQVNQYTLTFPHQWPWHFLVRDLTDKYQIVSYSYSLSDLKKAVFVKH